MANSTEARVARGACLLDEQEPGWFKRVDPDRLDMLSVRDDVLGQTWQGPARRNPSSAHYDVLFPDPVNEVASGFGFDGKSRRELTLLGDEWARVVHARRGGA